MAADCRLSHWAGSGYAYPSKLDRAAYGDIWGSIALLFTEQRGKIPLNVGEIRSAFLAASAFGDNLRRFRSERIARAIEIDLPLSLGDGAKILLHLVPLSALDPTAVRDVVTGSRDTHLRMEPMSGPGNWSRRYNFEGLMTFPSGIASFVQLLRSGVIEAAEGDFFKWTQDGKSIPTTALKMGF